MKMVASDASFAPRAPAVKRSDGGELQEVLQTMSLNEDDRVRGLPSEDGGAVLTTIAVAKKSRTREVASRYKAATVSSANAAAITAQRYQSPTRGRSPSPHLGRNNNDASTAAYRAAPPDRRPASAERRRPWPTSASENKTPTTNSMLDPSRTSISSLKKFSGVRDVGVWPSSINTLSSSIQSDTSNSSSSNESRLEQKIHKGLSGSGQGEATNHSLKSTQNSEVLDSVRGSLQGQITPERRSSPERRRTPLRRSLNAPRQTENSKPVVENQASKVDSYRRPGAGNAKTLMSRSMDFTLEKEGTISHATSSLLARSASKVDKTIPSSRSLSRSANECTNPNVVRRIYMDPGEERASKSDCLDEYNSSAWEIEEEIGRRLSLMHANSLDDNGSDTESSSSGSLSVASSGGNLRAKGTVVPARFWLDSTGTATATATIRRLKAPSSTRSMTPIMQATNSGHSTPQSPLSPASQAKPMQVFSPSRGLASPTRGRTGHPMLMSQRSLNGRCSNVSGLLSLNLDSRKNKKTMGQQEEAHDLRLLHNRWLQWHFVNARAELAMSTQTAAADSLLYKCFSRTCDLRMSVATKQVERNKIRQALKLDSALVANAVQLEEWESLQFKHSTALTSVMEALEATIVRVPLIGGPKIDIQATKEVLSSATDIMNAVDTSVSKFLHKAELADSLLSELAKTIILEKASLVECGDLLAAAAALETEERSLRTYLIQMEHEKMCSLGSTTTTV